MPLTEKACAQAQPKTKDYKLADARSMYLLVRPNGQKWWRFRYQLNGKEQSMSLGIYPDIDLNTARLRRDEARASLAVGKKPEKAIKKPVSRPPGMQFFEGLGLVRDAFIYLRRVNKTANSKALELAIDRLYEAEMWVKQYMMVDGERAVFALHFSDPLLAFHGERTEIVYEGYQRVPHLGEEHYTKNPVVEFPVCTGLTGRRIVTHVALWSVHGKTFSDLIDVSRLKVPIELRVGEAPRVTGDDMVPVVEIVSRSSRV